MVPMLPAGLTLIFSVISPGLPCSRALRVTWFRSSLSFSFTVPPPRLAISFEASV